MFGCVMPKPARSRISPARPMPISVIVPVSTSCVRRWRSARRGRVSTICWWRPVPMSRNEPCPSWQGQEWSPKPMMIRSLGFDLTCASSGTICVVWDNYRPLAIESVPSPFHSVNSLKTPVGTEPTRSAVWARDHLLSRRPSPGTGGARLQRHGGGGGGPLRGGGGWRISRISGAFRGLCHLSQRERIGVGF